MNDSAFDVAGAARALLDANWREGTYRGLRYAFSVPSPRSYPWQWYWDSCFHAVVRARWEPDRARDELETLLGAMEPDGFIGHTILWGSPLDWQRTIRYNIASRADLMTRTIQPPVLAWAWSLAVGEPRAESRIASHHAWLREHRDLEGDGLLWILQPDESGMDASPKFDHIWGRTSQGRPLFPWLIHRNRLLGFDARRVAAAGRPVVCEVMTNVAWSLSEQALGNPSPTPRLLERLYDERTGRFADDVRHARHPTRPPSGRARGTPWRRWRCRTCRTTSRGASSTRSSSPPPSTTACRCRPSRSTTRRTHPARRGGAATDTGAGRRGSTARGW